MSFSVTSLYTFLTMYFFSVVIIMSENLISAKTIPPCRKENLQSELIILSSQNRVKIVHVLNPISRLHYTSQHL